jgi:hypothetical protein
MRTVATLFLVLIVLKSKAQLLQKNAPYRYDLAVSDTTHASLFYKKAIAIPASLNKKRYKNVAIGSVALWGGSLLFLNEAWYKNYDRGAFHFYNDGGEWRNVDKVGHIYSAYLGSKLFTHFFRWTGASEKKSVLLGAGGGFAYQSIIEILDGFSTKWGFSTKDVAANAIGCGLFAGQQLLWKEQRIKLKFSFYIKDYTEPELVKRANNLYGYAFAQRMFKDYNAQTYWASVNIKSFAKQSQWPAWLNIAVGYGANGMLGGYKNEWTNENGITISRPDIKRYNQFFISPDIDFSKIPFKNPLLRDFFRIVNLKFPFPSLEYNTLNGFGFNAYHF